MTTNKRHPISADRLVQDVDRPCLLRSSGYKPILKEKLPS